MVISVSEHPFAEPENDGVGRVAGSKAIVLAQWGFTKVEREKRRQVRRPGTAGGEPAAADRSPASRTLHRPPGRAKTLSTARGGAVLGRRLMTRRGWRRSGHFLESPAGAARCTQRRSREPAAAAMSHQTGIQGNGARRGPRGRDSREIPGEPGGLRAWQGQSRAGSAGTRSRRASRASALPRSGIPGSPGLRLSWPPPRCRRT